MNERRGFPVLLTAAVALLATLAVKADGLPVGLQFAGVNPGLGNVGYESWTLPFVSGNTSAGAYLQTLDPSTPVTTLNLFVDRIPPVTTFCIDLSQYTQPPPEYTTYYLVDPATAPRPNGVGLYPEGMGETRADWLRVLAGEYWDTSYDPVTGVGGALSIANINSISAKERANYAAFQMAVWEIVFEGDAADALPLDIDSQVDWDVAQGDFWITNSLGTAIGDARAVADDWLDQIESIVYVNYGGNVADAADGCGVELGALANPALGAVLGYQDYLVRTTVPVPEPSGLALAGLGLLGLLSRRKARA